MKKKLKLKLPTMVELVAGVRTGVRPGQVFKDKRKAKDRKRIEQDMRYELGCNE